MPYFFQACIILYLSLGLTIWAAFSLSFWVTDDYLTMLEAAGEPLERFGVMSKAVLFVWFLFMMVFAWLPMSLMGLRQFVSDMWGNNQPKL